LKTAVDLIIDKLAPDDVLSIVTFSDRAELVQPPTHVSNRQAILSQVRQIRASGGTEIYQGLSAGLQALRQVSLSKYNNHIILLTDGHTYGDAAECVDLASRAVGQQIGLSAFGLGSEWNDEFLDSLVSFSGGQSAFIEEPEQIVAHLQKRIQGLGQIHARNICLSMPATDAISLHYAFKLLPFAQPVSTTPEGLRLGNIEGKGALSVLLELAVPPQQNETRIPFPVELTADIPSRNLKDYKLKTQIQLLVVADPPAVDLPQDLVKAVRLLNMYRMNEKVWEEVAAGNVGQAATRLRHLTTRLLEAGEIRLAQQAHAETERLKTIGSLSSEGRKKLKYGTRAMIGGIAELESNDSV
jgi:Ca-activated chloride channel homolog